MFTSPCTRVTPMTEGATSSSSKRSGEARISTRYGTRDSSRTGPGEEQALLADLETRKAPSGDVSGPAQWAEESCRIVAAPGFYPDRRKVGDSYGTDWQPALQDRLSLAGQRLARLLNESFTQGG